MEQEATQTWKEQSGVPASYSLPRATRSPVQGLCHADCLKRFRSSCFRKVSHHTNFLSTISNTPTRQEAEEDSVMAATERSVEERPDRQRSSRTRAKSLSVDDLRAKNRGTQSHDVSLYFNAGLFNTDGERILTQLLQTPSYPPCRLSKSIRSRKAGWSSSPIAFLSRSSASVTAVTT